MRKFNVGFIGCGGIAVTHAERLKTLEEIHMAAFADIVKERAKIMAEKYGGRYYSDWREMLNRENLDIVYICLPPFAHSDEVMVAAEKGIHVFIEKPIALDMKIAREMVRSIQKNRVKSQVGYNCRFGYAIEEAKRLVSSGEAGEVGLTLGMYWCHFIRKDWWIDKSKSGGQIVEQSTHLFDALRYICGDVEVVYGLMNRKFWIDVPEMTIEDVSSVAFRFKSGAVGAITATIWGANAQWWFKWLIAAKNYTFESRDINTLTLYSTRPPTKVMMVSEERDTYLLEAKDLIRAILEDKETRTPIEEGAKTLEFTLAASKSAETGKPVMLPLEE
ncbi:MAG: Gfo/Idh/MocA family oxidoreductase [Candidatus Bathyarchaeota archaeon]|nr:Gfo/Idh/MocA family oxidoreductase [Candidatus Bathyarchaeota archaeon]